MLIEDLVKYENESTRLDFKATQYRKEQFEALIKDIMSMANADLLDDKYIVVGLKHRPHGDKEILGIEKTEFVDAAIYQQIIYENIEPEINLDYLPYEFKGSLLGVFRITNCNEKPYMMKKDFKNLKKGDSFIRKGTQQMKMVRSDFIKIFNSDNTTNVFKDNVKMVFEGHKTNQIFLKPKEIGKLPSQLAASKIKEILEKKKAEQQDIPKEILRALKMPSIGGAFIGSKYEDRSIEELEKNLEKVKETYREDDNYEFFEKHSYKVNLIILNESNQYIEDASIQIYINKNPYVFIASEFYEKPSNNKLFSMIDYTPSFKSLNYPKVVINEMNYNISEEIGHIRHHIPTKAFKVPLRIVITNKSKGQLIFNCKIYGKNLSFPIESELIIGISED